jgi:hypothetical protein
MTDAPGSARTSLGYPRNQKYFFAQALKQYPELFSPENVALINKGKPPLVDAQWLKYHPGQEFFLGDVLVHHHIEQGPYAVAIPESFHVIFHQLLHPVTYRQ